MQKHMHSGTTVCTGLSVHFLINSPLPTFIIFLAFILYSHLYTFCIHLVHFIFLLYLLALSILLNSTLFYPVCFQPSAVPVDGRTPNLPHSPLSHCSLTL